jgi:DNA-binding transcriptional LysR family regulator
MVQEEPTTNARNSIRLTTVATLASCWLLPRLPRLQAVHPHLQLTISTTNHAVDFSRDEFDCGIRHGMGLWPGLESTLIFKEILVLAGSPSLLRRITGKHIARSLRSTPIIAVKTRRSDLARWWHGNGLEGSPPRARLVVENRSQALAAVVAGNGLTVIDARFIAAPGRDTPIGRLPGYEVPLPEGYYFVVPHRHASRRNIKLLRAWLTSEV